MMCEITDALRAIAVELGFISVVLLMMLIFKDTKDEFHKTIEHAEPIKGKDVSHGEWIVKGQDIFCSECGEESAYTWRGASKFSNYCPNCGAKMDGGADDGGHG